MNIDYYIVDAESSRAVAMADDPAGFSPYRRDKILKLKPIASKRLSAAAGIATAKGLESFGLRENETEFGSTEQGKPYIIGHPEIVFNVSHSGKYAVAAFMRDPDYPSSGGYALGVDIEQISRMNERIASFMKADIGFEGTTEAENREDTCRRWTAREAFLKCIGLGISAFRDDFYFEKTPAGGMILHQNIADGQFEVIEAEAPAGYCITCVVQKPVIC